MKSKLLVVFSLIGICSLTACGASPAPDKPQQAALPAANMTTTTPGSFPGTQAPTRQVATRVPLPTDPPSFPGSKWTFDTRVAQREIATKTAWALTPTEPRGSPTATWTPRPTPTVTIGWVECGSGDSQRPQYVICWQATLDGQVILVQAGREGHLGDIGQGVVTVSILGQDGRYHDDGTYLTPMRQGAVRIASVDGTRVYLVVAEFQPPDSGATPIATPGMVFIFDLATRQWVSP